MRGKLISLKYRAMANKYEDINYKSFCDHRILLDNKRIELSIFLEKNLLLISSGGLYLSVLFIGLLGGLSNVIDKHLLFIGWLFTILSIFSIIISVWLSEAAFGKQIDITDKEIENLNRGSETSHDFIVEMHCCSKDFPKEMKKGSPATISGEISKVNCIPKIEMKNRWTSWVSLSRLIYSYCFILGIIYLILFYFRNL